MSASFNERLAADRRLFLLQRLFDARSRSMSSLTLMMWLRQVGPCDHTEVTTQLHWLADRNLVRLEPVMTPGTEQYIATLTPHGADAVEGHVRVDGVTVVER